MASMYVQKVEALEQLASTCAEQKLEELKKEEQELQFDSFTNEDALELGIALVREAQSQGCALSAEIRMNHSTLFYYRCEGTNDHNSEWMRRKANTVDKLGMSTMRLYYDLAYTQRSLKDDYFLDPMVYAARGGGFPLTVRGLGVVGTICVSGLFHPEDHALLVRVLRRYLEQKKNGNHA